MKTCDLYIGFTLICNIIHYSFLTFVAQQFSCSLNYRIMKTEEKKTNEPLKISGDWNVQSKRLKENHSQLTDADLKFETGKEEDLLSRLQTKLNKKRDEVINIIRKGQPAKV